MYPRALMWGNPSSVTLTWIFWINFPSYPIEQFTFIIFRRKYNRTRLKAQLQSARTTPQLSHPHNITHTPYLWLIPLQGNRNTSQHHVLSARASGGMLSLCFTKKIFVKYSMSGPLSKNAMRTRACALVHAPTSRVMRRNPKDQKKARLTDSPQVLAPPLAYAYGSYLPWRNIEPACPTGSVVVTLTFLVAVNDKLSHHRLTMAEDGRCSRGLQTLTLSPSLLPWHEHLRL